VPRSGYLSERRRTLPSRRPEAMRTRWSRRSIERCLARLNGDTRTRTRLVVDLRSPSAKAIVDNDAAAPAGRGKPRRRCYQNERIELNTERRRQAARPDCPGNLHVDRVAGSVHRGMRRIAAGVGRGPDRARDPGVRPRLAQRVLIRRTPGLLAPWVIVIPEYVPAFAAVTVVPTLASVVLSAVEVDTDMY